MNRKQNLLNPLSPYSAQEPINPTLIRKRLTKSKKSDAELIQLFWLAPEEAYFDQFTVAPVTGRAPKTLESDRWRRSGIPFRKCLGRVLYRKSDVIQWIESHKLIRNTTEHAQTEKCHEQ